MQCASRKRELVAVPRSLSLGNLLGELSPVNAANLIAFRRASSPSLPDNVVYELVQNDLRMEGRPSHALLSDEN